MVKDVIFGYKPDCSANEATNRPVISAPGPVSMPTTAQFHLLAPCASYAPVLVKHDVRPARPPLMPFGTPEPILRRHSCVGFVQTVSASRYRCSLQSRQPLWVAISLAQTVVRTRTAPGATYNHVPVCQPAMTGGTLPLIGCEHSFLQDICRRAGPQCREGVAVRGGQGRSSSSELRRGLHAHRYA